MAIERLVETRLALHELRAHEEQGFGLHLGNEVAVGVPGIEIGEIPFDPSRHSAEVIDPFTMGEIMTETPHVMQVMPYRPLSMSVVLHQDPRDRRMNEFVQPIRGYKQQLVLELQEAILEARQIMDTAELYVVGDNEELNGLSAESSVIEGTDEPEAAAEAIAEICRRGLTFVISNFDQLPLAQVKALNATTAIAVKANHEFELAIPAKVGTWPMGGLWEPNTHSRRELQRANEQIAQRHAEIEGELGSIGLLTAHVVYRNSLETHLVSQKADGSIAAAIRALGRHQA